MPEFHLLMKAELENIELLLPIESNYWMFDIQSSSGEIRNGITFSEAEDFDLEGSKGKAHFIIKWPGERDQSYMKIVPIKKCDGKSHLLNLMYISIKLLHFEGKYKNQDSGNFVRI